MKKGKFFEIFFNFIHFGKLHSAEKCDHLYSENAVVSAENSGTGLEKTEENRIVWHQKPFGSVRNSNPLTPASEIH